MARILVVDDSITVAKFTEMTLSAVGHEITFAMNGNECMQKLNSRTFDLIILDVVMPGKNGFQLCREIKADVRFGEIPVILMTTKNQAADKFWGMRQGADEYLVKPCAEEELIRAVNKYAHSHEAAGIQSPVNAISFPASEIPAEATAVPPVNRVEKDKQEEAPLSAEDHKTDITPPADRSQDSFCKDNDNFAGRFVRIKREETVPEPVESVGAPLSQAKRAATRELPALPPEDKGKKPLTLKERLQNSLYRFN
jgi:twitching motility two-component system response regulator PilH